MSQLERINILEFEIKKLNSRRGVLVGEIEKLETETNKKRKDAEKEMDPEVVP